MRQGFVWSAAWRPWRRGCRTARGVSAWFTGDRLRELSASAAAGGAGRTISRRPRSIKREALELLPDGSREYDETASRIGAARPADRVPGRPAARRKGRRLPRKGRDPRRCAQLGQAPPLPGAGRDRTVSLQVQVRAGLHPDQGQVPAGRADQGQDFLLDATLLRGLLGPVRLAVRAGTGALDLRPRDGACLHAQSLRDRAAGSADVHPLRLRALMCGFTRSWTTSGRTRASGLRDRPGGWGRRSVASWRHWRWSLRCWRPLPRWGRSSTCST